jgi:hypothetical protein
MKKSYLAFFAIMAAALTSTSAFAERPTMHGRDLHREGKAIHMSNFDVKLDGRMLTAKEGVYHPNTGVVELKGEVRLHFGKDALTFPGEVK